MNIIIEDNYKKTDCIYNKDDISGLLKYGNKSIEYLNNCLGNLIVYPSLDSVEFDYSLLQEKLFEYYDFNETDVYLNTNNLVGFFGCGNINFQIFSRFADKTDKGRDYFLYYLIEKVYSLNIINLKHSISVSNGIKYLFLLFPKVLKEALEQGIYKEYTSNCYNDSNFNGIIDVDRLIRNNIPFNGNISYIKREYTAKNRLFYLVRWTIELLKRYNYDFLLMDSSEIRKYVLQIENLTSDYNKISINKLLYQNEKKKIVHPYYNKYYKLQDLCIRILREEQSKYENNSDKIYGCIFNISVLWEEYINKVLEDHGLNFKHPNNRTGSGALYLFENSKEQPRYIDFYNDDIKILIDTKYKKLGNDRDDYNQILTYMYLTRYNKSILLYPESDDIAYKKKILASNSYGGAIYQIGLDIPKNVEDYTDYKRVIKDNEYRLVTKIMSIEKD